MNQKYLTTLLADETVFEAEATPFGPVTNFWGIPEKKFEACRPNEEVNELESKLQKNQNKKKKFSKNQIITIVYSRELET
jgi:hypothetical protein